VSYHIKRKFNAELSVSQAQRFLHKLGFTLQRPSYAFPKADPGKQEEFLNDFKKVWVLSEKTAYFFPRRGEHPVFTIDHFRIFQATITPQDFLKSLVTNNLILLESSSTLTNKATHI